MTKPRQTPLLDPSHAALSADRPLFVDNRDGNKLDLAICRHLQSMRRERRMLWELPIASAFFDVPGFDLIATELL